MNPVAVPLHPFDKYNECVIKDRARNHHIYIAPTEQDLVKAMEWLEG
jgi:hypothetical protein